MQLPARPPFPEEGEKGLIGEGRSKKRQVKEKREELGGGREELIGTHQEGRTGQEVLKDVL